MRMVDADEYIEKLKAELIPQLKELISFRVNELREDIENMKYSQHPTKLDKISQYLTLLYGAQRADHRVDKEIAEALQLYREESGI